MNKKHARQVVCTSHPSLALIKYWGKRESRHKNVPASTSIAVSIDTLESKVIISEAEKNEFFLNGDAQDFEIVHRLLAALMACSQGLAGHFWHKTKRFAQASDFFIHIEAQNNFPTAAGLASSSSGYAALVCGLAKFLEMELSEKALSSVARIGSGSACRAVYGGFTIWRAGALHARQLFLPVHWQDFCVVVCAPRMEKKEISSRRAMIHTRQTSAYYRQWCKYNNALEGDVVQAIADKDIEKLGDCVRQSYSAMHASMLAAHPPVMYWKEESVTLIALAAELRSKGLPVWETMDAGPQVKFITLIEHAEKIEAEVKKCFSDIWVRVCRVGHAPKVELVGEALQTKLER